MSPLYSPLITQLQDPALSHLMCQRSHQQVIPSMIRLVHRSYQRLHRRECHHFRRVNHRRSDLQLCRLFCRQRSHRQLLHLRILHSLRQLLRPLTQHLRQRVEHVQSTTLAQTLQRLHPQHCQARSQHYFHLLFRPRQLPHPPQRARPPVCTHQPDLFLMIRSILIRPDWSIYNRVNEALSHHKVGRRILRRANQHQSRRMCRLQCQHGHGVCWHRMELCSVLTPVPKSHSRQRWSRIRCHI